jgi:adenylate cyclase
MSDIFISYARSTADQAQQVAEALRGLGYNVWRDDEIPAHRAYAEVIEERLRSAKGVVVIWSAEAAKSQWVRAEANVAREAGTLVQLRVDGAVPPLPFNEIQCANLVGWTGDLTAHEWKKVVASVAELIGGTAAQPPNSQAKRGPAVHKLSICVLPFANMSGEAEQEYFSDGISEDVITDLSKVSALQVIARNTAFQFKSKAVDVSAIARQLNVGHVLEGSVRKAGNRVRVTAQLIDGATGAHVWAERYDRDLDDIFALQDEISEAIVSALRLKLLPEEKQAIERRGTANVEAYNIYLMARQHSLSSSEGDPRRNETIVRLCRRAVEIDPDYAQAWALLALGQTLHFFFADKQDGDDGLAAVERAMALDASLAEPHAVKARHLANQGFHDRAVAEIEMALRLGPESFEVNSAAAALSFRQRRLEDAAGYFEKAMSLMEADLGSPGMLLSCYTALGDEAGLRRTAKIALARSEKALAQEPTNGKAMGFGVNALAALGKGDRAREWIGRALLLDPDNWSMRFNFACALNARLGDAEGALSLLESVLTRASGAFLAHIKADTDIDSLRNDPRFKAMIAAAEARLAAAEPADAARA